jgi:SAM-dependent methyltransferase
MTNASTSPEFFEQIYRQKPDPWHFASSKYEVDRYRTIINALNSRRYARAFEPGCSIGILTALLAPMCGAVEAMDISSTAVERARGHCKNLANVNIACGALPRDIPDGTFDLVVFSEIGYYFDGWQLEKLGDSLVSRLTMCGTLLATHWLGESSDHVLSGDQVHEVLASLKGLTHSHAERRAEFRLDRWERR